MYVYMCICVCVWVYVCVKFVQGSCDLVITSYILTFDQLEIIVIQFICMCMYFNCMYMKNVCICIEFFMNVLCVCKICPVSIVIIIRLKFLWFNLYTCICMYMHVCICIYVFMYYGCMCMYVYVCECTYM